MGLGPWAAGAVSAWQRTRRAGAVLLPLLIIGITAWELRRQASAMDWPALRTALSGIGPLAISESVLATAASFLGLALIEGWAVRSSRGTGVPVATSLVTGAASHAISHVLGWHAVLGTLVRQRAYSAHGVSPSQLLRILLGVGMAVAAGSLVTVAISAASWHSLASGWGMAFALVLLSFWGWGSASVEPSIQPRGVSAHKLKKVAAIVPIAALESLACLAALWVLLPAGTFASWPAFVVTCLLAQAAGVASHVPGGIGVFEAAMLAAAPADSRPGLLAAILAYRAVYGLIPFALIGLPWLAWTSMRPMPRVSQLESG